MYGDEYTFPAEGPAGEEPWAPAGRPAASGGPSGQGIQQRPRPPSVVELEEFARRTNLVFPQVGAVHILSRTTTITCNDPALAPPCMQLGLHLSAPHEQLVAELENQLGAEAVGDLQAWRGRRRTAQECAPCLLLLSSPVLGCRHP